MEGDKKILTSRNLRVGTRVIYILLFHCISFVLFDILPCASITFSMQVLKKLVKKEQKILLLKASSSHHSRVPNPANHSSTPSVSYSSLLLFYFPTICSSLLVFFGLPWRSRSSLSAQHDGVNIQTLVLISHFLKTSQHPTGIGRNLLAFYSECEMQRLKSWRCDWLKCELTFCLNASNCFLVELWNDFSLDLSFHICKPGGWDDLQVNFQPCVFGSVW